MTLWMPVLSGWRFSSRLKPSLLIEELQAVLSLHKMRRQLVKFRTAQINALHGLLLEFGETVRKGRVSLDKAMPEVLERPKEKLPPFLIYQIEDQYRRLSDLDMQIDGIEKQLAA